MKRKIIRLIIITLPLLIVLFSSCKSAKEKSMDRLEKLYENVCLTKTELTAEEKNSYLSELEIVHALLSQYTYNQQEKEYIENLLADCAKELNVEYTREPTHEPSDNFETPSGWTDDEMNNANTAANVDYLTEEEKQVIYYTNLARLYGPKFANLYVNKLLQDDRNDYVSSLYQDLLNTKDMKALIPNPTLHETAKYHALDMGRNGMTGHNSSDGTSFGNRVMKQYGVHLIGENCYYGPSDPFDIVMSLLIDKGVRNLGHRKNLLNADFREIGVSIERHNSAYQYNCVQDFGSKE